MTNNRWFIIFKRVWWNTHKTCKFPFTIFFNELFSFRRRCNLPITTCHNSPLIFGTCNSYYIPVCCDASYILYTYYRMEFITIWQQIGASITWSCICTTLNAKLLEIYNTNLMGNHHKNTPHLHPHPIHKRSSPVWMWALCFVNSRAK